MGQSDFLFLSFYKVVIFKETADSLTQCLTSAFFAARKDIEEVEV